MSNRETPMVQSDSSLIEACLRGEAEAWETLVRRYERLVYTIPRRAGLDEQQAAEVFQSVFEKLVQHLGKLEQPDRVHAWLVTTARRESWRLLREHKKVDAQISIDAEEAHEHPAGLPLPDEIVQQLEEQQMVRNALEQLEEGCRRLLRTLFYRDGAPPYAEVATALGIPAGSIGPTRARCLQKLRGLLVKTGF